MFGATPRRRRCGVCTTVFPDKSGPTGSRRFRNCGSEFIREEAGAVSNYRVGCSDVFPDKSGPTRPRRFRNCGSEFIREEAETGTDCLADCTDAFPDESAPTRPRRFRNCGSEFIREETGTVSDYRVDCSDLFPDKSGPTNFADYSAFAGSPNVSPSPSALYSLRSALSSFWSRLSRLNSAFWASLVTRNNSSILM